MLVLEHMLNKYPESRALTKGRWRCQGREHYWGYARLEIYVVGGFCAGPE